MTDLGVNVMLYKKIVTSGIAALLASSAHIALAQSGEAVSLQEAIAVAVNSNPEIAQAQFNKEAIQFERKQAQGLYAPRFDVEASAGIRHLDNTTRRTLGISGQELYPLEAQARGDWTLIDFGRRSGELRRQAARVDGASLRVVERSEFIALQVARQYLDVMLQQRVFAASQDNVVFHRAMVNDLGTGVQQGSISIADQQQAQERLQAALVRQTEAEQAVEDAKITIRRLTGLDLSNVQMPPTLAENSAKGDMFPKIGVDVTGRIGEDIDGFKGATRDVQGRAYIRWNVFDGGINRAKYQEMVRRASESRYRLYQVAREAEEDVRAAWNALRSQTRISEELMNQSRVSDDLLLSYRSQFNVGRRSLLDVLDAQNTRYNVQVRLETARFSQVFARYQSLAATNRLLASFNIAPGAGAGATERDRFKYGPPQPAELQRRTEPK